jgi:hypothetical protein
MTSSVGRTPEKSARDGRDAGSSSILAHGDLPEDHAVGRLHREGGIWDWDEHRATYDLAAKRAMVLLDDLRSMAGMEGAIARGLFSIATSSDEDHFAVRMNHGRSDVYKWPTVPPAEESKDVVLVGAFLGARRRAQGLLEPQDIPLAVRRALIINRNVPVLILVVTEEGLVGRRFQLRPEFFARLIAAGDPLDASEADVELSAGATLLTRPEVSARFKDLIGEYRHEASRGMIRALLNFFKRRYGWRRL